MDLNNIVGFKAVDKNGNERQVTVDEMTELVSARIVSAASEISTFAAAAAAGTDEFEDQLPQSDTFSWLRTLDGSKNPTLTSSSAAAKVLGELIGTASAEKDGLMGKEYTIRYIYNAGLSISYDVNGTSFYSTTSLIELFLYSTGSVAYYRILATPNKNIIIRYLGNNDCDFKLNGNILYVLPRHTDITIKYKIGLYRNDIPDFATISISDFANITGNIITPTAG
ncbi:hypothetical protein ACR76B_22200 [Phocaeicola vulgatus]|uniref:hypothetical protein n=2 Tax=Phocaeicola vulgatus TaxID=821 RepID=UPI002307441A|nr:hypothetical protein [Phocaeicola vulgatus]